MTEAPSTTVQWTMRLADAALVVKALSSKADEFERSADYLESDRYAADSAKRWADAAPEGETRDPADWERPQSTLNDIARYRADAARLRELAEA